MSHENDPPDDSPFDSDRMGQPLGGAPERKMSRFERRVRGVVDAMFAERVPAYREALNVDAEIEAEIARKWDRSNPPNPFGLLESIKAERPGSWVTPEMSLRMFATVETLARAAYNEATK